MYRIMSYHIMSCHVTSRHVTSRHVMSCHVMSCHVISCHLMSSHVMSYHIISYHITSYRIVPYHTVPFTVHRDEMDEDDPGTQLVTAEPEFLVFEVRGMSNTVAESHTSRRERSRNHDSRITLFVIYKLARNGGARSV